MKRKVSVGEAVSAMVLNALGFVSRPLYLTPEFFANKPVDLLSRSHLCAAEYSQRTTKRRKSSNQLKNLSTLKRRLYCRKRRPSCVACFLRFFYEGLPFQYTTPPQKRI